MNNYDSIYDSIIDEMWDTLEHRKVGCKQILRTYNWLKSDKFYGIAFWGNNFWTLDCGTNYVPKYVFSYVYRYMKSKGLKWLGDIDR